MKVKNKNLMLILFILLSLTVFGRNSPKFTLSKIILDDYPKITIELDGNGTKTVDLFYETDKKGTEIENYADQVLGNREDLVYTSTLNLEKGSIVKVYFRVRNGTGNGGSTVTSITGEYKVPKTIVEEPETPDPDPEIPNPDPETPDPEVPDVPEVPETPVVKTRTIKINSKISNQSRLRESNIKMIKTDDKEDFDIESVQDTSSE